MSEVKVNKISPRTACGTVTLGDSGDTFTIPAGATITNNGTAAGFGATGAASWDTTVKTGDFTAVSGVGYFVNTTSGEIDVTLPASPSAGSVVAVKDYANTWDTHNCILLRNGSKIGSVANDAILSTEGLAVTLVYVDAIQGWLVTDDGNQSVASTNPFLAATGGTETESGNFRIHTFTGPGTFSVTKLATSSPNNALDYLIVAGGGGAGAREGSGGGGAGGFRETPGTSTGSYTVSPIAGSVSAFNATVNNFPIVVGGGGAGGVGGGASNPGSSGGNSTFNSSVSTGGGGGGVGDGGGAGNPLFYGNPGGSGGGSGGRIGGACSTASKGVGNTPPVSPSQGSTGGAAKTCTSNSNDSGGGGGGATAVGLNASSPEGPSGDGGAGTTTSISATPTAYAGGGAGGNNSGGTPAGTGGTGGGGNGSTNAIGVAGTTNRGGGGGGPGTTCGPSFAGGAGGSGIVVIRYKFQ